MFISERCASKAKLIQPTKEDKITLVKHVNQMSYDHPYPVYWWNAVYGDIEVGVGKSKRLALLEAEVNLKAALKQIRQNIKEIG